MKYPQVVSMPSAVSNWLDEQLEARGIDAVVYTRYVLSLLHSHTVDVLYPDEDLEFSHSKKEVRRSNRSYIGSHRSSSDWWRHAHADAERIKRSAAVECLLSASEQNCEIESLVDELCEKLKEVNDDSALPAPATNSTTTSSSTSAEVDPGTKDAESNKKITPQELAEKYYAAFPPLCPQSPSESKLLSLIPKWRNVTTSSSTTTSPVKKKAAKKVNKQLSFCGNRSYLKESNDTMKARSQNKQRFNCLGRSKNNNNNFRNNAALGNWDLNFFTTTNNKKLTSLKQNNHKEDQMQEALDQCINIGKDIWSNEDEMNMYDDLPVDIKDLLDSPTPHDDTVEMMNIANMRDTGKRRFIPYGTNIMGNSIWSTDQDVAFDNNFNSSIDDSSSTNTNDLALDFKFISIDNPTINFDDWPPADSSAENETNTLFETKNRCRRSLFLDEFRSLPGEWRSPSTNEEDKDVDEEEECFENEKLMNRMAMSLLKLNHDKEKSGFVEVSSGAIPRTHSYNPFGKRPNNAFTFTSKFSYSDTTDKEDLLLSGRTHFKPICAKNELSAHHLMYADGCSFPICNNLDKVDYKRSETGTRLLENEFGQSKKYFEYKMMGDLWSKSEPEFVLKFSVCQNDKSCQTDDSKLDFEAIENCKLFEGTMNVCISPSPDVVDGCSCPEDAESLHSDIDKNKDDFLFYSQPVARSESMLSEVVWKYEEKNCDKCSDGSRSAWSRGGDWSSKGQMDSDWDDNGLRSIWSGGEVCQKCLTQNASDNQPKRPNRQLRDDISQDGEQLLSDLSSIQKTYMDDLPLLAERSLDLSELISATTASGGATSKERKRRHSLIVDYNPDSWSFASRLEEDCLMQMAALPDLRAVTL